MKNTLFFIFLLASLYLHAQVNCDEVRSQYAQYKAGTPNANTATLLSTQLEACIRGITDQKTKVIWTYNLLKLFVDAQQYERARDACDFCMNFAGSAYPSYYNNCFAFKHSLNGYTASNSVGRGASYSGKGDYFEEIVNAEEFDQVEAKPFSGDEYERFIARRLKYPSGQLPEYMTYFKELAGTEKSMTQGPFLLIGHDNQPSENNQENGTYQRQMPAQYAQTKTKGGGPRIEQRSSSPMKSASEATKDLHLQLNELLVHLKDEYDLDNPDYYIPLYLYNSDIEGDAYNRFSDFAYKIHGRSASGRVAYFNPIDLSVVAWLATGNGTLSHEVVHALVLQDYSMIPGWLNEGFAAMFEETSHQFYPMDNYRLIYLKQAMRYGKMLNVQQLLEASRDEFDGSERTMLYAATARYFVMFLRDKGWLPSVYSSLKQSNLNDSVDVTNVLVQKTGYGVSALNMQFTNWLKYQQVPSKWASLESSIENYIRKL